MFELCKGFCYGGFDCVQIWCFFGLGDNQVDYCFFKIGVWYIDNSVFQNMWLVIQDQFDFFGIDIIFVGNDQVFVVVDDMDIFVFICFVQVFGDEEFIGVQFCCGFIWYLLVVFEDIWVLNFDLVNFVLW